MKRMIVKKNPLSTFLHKSALKVKEADIHRRMVENFAKFADNPVVRWESQQQRDLAFIGGILVHGEQSVPVALAVLPTLATLAHLTPEQAMRQGKREWEEAMRRLSREVLKLGAGPQAETNPKNTTFSLEGMHNAHRN